MKRKMTSIDEPTYDGEWVVSYCTTTFYSPDCMFISPYNEIWPEYEELYEIVAQNQFRKWF